MTGNTRGDSEMSTQNSVVAAYHTHTEADQAVKELQRGGVDMHKLSIVGKGYHTDEQAVSYTHLDVYKRQGLHNSAAIHRTNRAFQKPRVSKSQNQC